jgi:enamine deaminase RidA (YjgF/YER057c/UK114 family)
MIRRESSQGIGYSVVELHGVRHIFAAAVPREGATLAGQTRSALRTIEDVVAEQGTRNSIVSQAVFIADGGRIDECHQIIREFYGEHMPATTYVPQHPCQGNLVAIEALGIGGGPGRVEIERHNEQVVTARHGGVAWTHISQIVPQIPAPGVYARSLNAFEQMREKLAAVNVPFDQIIRTWLYLGDIVGPEGETQRYKELNRARSDYYENIRFLAKHVMPGVTETVYPASTGIGTDIRDIIMSCIAVTTKRDDLVIRPLENPLQTSAFDYMASYGPKSPKFSRAMALTAGECATFFISGTASITQSESQHIENVEAQTNQTLDNIAALISDQNACRHGLRGRGATLRDLAIARVYIKRQEDYAKTREVCEERLGELPVIYAVADVCRPELLVEIEAVGFSTHCAGS